MASKKLKVEVELETAKAKRQAKELEQSGGGSATGGAGSVASNAEKMAKALEKASKKSDDFAKSAGEMSSQTRRLITGFAGIGAGLAMNYAANFMQQGKTRENVEAAGSAVAAASSSAMLAQLLPHPLLKVLAVSGSAAGGYFSKKAEQKKAFEDYTAEWNRSEENYRKSSEFAELLRSLSTVKDGFNDFKGRIEEINSELEKRKDEEKELIKKINEAREARKYDVANNLRGDLSMNRSQQLQLKGSLQSVEAMQEADSKKRIDDRAGFSAPDALSKIGGMFVGDKNNTALNTAATTMKEQLEVLKRIEQKKGGMF